MNPRISCITLPVDDLQKSIAFYRTGMRFPAEKDAADGEGDQALFSLPGDLYLVLTRREEFAGFTKLGNLSPAPRGQTECILSYFTTSREEVDEILAAVKSAGGTAPRAASEKPWGYAGYCSDPDGHLWEILWNQDLHEETTEPLGEMLDPNTVRMERLLPGTVERIWAYLTEPEKRAKWFAGGSMELRPGGSMELTFDNSGLSPRAEEVPEEFKEDSCVQCMRGQIIRCEPPRLLTFSFGGMPGEASEVTFELTARGENTLLVLTHSRLPSREMMLSVCGGWHTHIGILIDHLAGRMARPFWSTHAKMRGIYDRILPANAGKAH